MKLQILLSIALFILSFRGVTPSTLTALLSPALSAWTSTDQHLLADFDWTPLNNTLAAEREAAVDTNARSALPNSYYAIRFLTTDGTWRRHNGVAILNNALLSSDHILPNDVKPEEVVQIQIASVTGDVKDMFLGSFTIQREKGYTVIVFRDPIIPEANIASLGDADELKLGAVVHQAVVIGAEKGIYPTFIRDHFTAEGIDGQPYSALRVSPDKTIVGDSGDPLYIDGVLYGINNAGDGICGAITDPDAIYQLVAKLTANLNHQRVDSVAQNSPVSETSNPVVKDTSPTINDETTMPQEQVIISPKNSGVEAIAE